jgi:hypothetical protein|tara:strand:+ start:810 stop:1637 length:828 start_codon:yes stop_codon:yes gene_type:complete
MANYTLTYDEGVQGFPSFYTYYPDWMIGMNNYFYTFKGGDLYRHNVNENRNTFYSDWWVKVGTPLEAFKPSFMKSVFNVSPLENKLFKTLNLEGDDAWAVTMDTDIQDSGFIDYDYFEKKEQSWYSFIRNEGLGSTPSAIPEYSLRSLNGIGQSTTVAIVGQTSTINFAITTQIGSILSVDDYFYFLVSGAPVYAGIVTSINVNLRRNINNIVIDTSSAGTTPIPTNTETFLYIKNSVAESHGVMGHYAVFNLTYTKNTKVELFAAESEVMKSFP